MRQQLVEANRAYQANDCNAATVKVDDIVRQYPEAAESAEAYYLRSLCRIGQQRTGEAWRDLDKCLQLSKRADLTARASGTLGGLQQDAGQLEAAVRSFEEALRVLPEIPPTDQIRYRYAMCLQRLGRWEDAQSAFASVIQQYPGSPCAEDARRRFSWKRKFFSVQCGAFVQDGQAAEMVHKLRGSLPEVWKEPEPRFGRPLYVVYAGKYSTFTQAQEGLQLARRLTPGAFVVP